MYTESIEFETPAVSDVDGHMEGAGACHQSTSNDLESLLLRDDFDDTSDEDAGLSDPMVLRIPVRLVPVLSSNSPRDMRIKSRALEIMSSVERSMGMSVGKSAEESAARDITPPRPTKRVTRRRDVDSNEGMDAPRMDAPRMDTLRMDTPRAVDPRKRYYETRPYHSRTEW
jgi:hypothetical protein